MIVFKTTMKNPALPAFKNQEFIKYKNTKERKYNEQQK